MNPFFSFCMYRHDQNNKLRKGIIDRIIGDCITSEQHCFPDNGKAFLQVCLHNDQLYFESAYWTIRHSGVFPKIVPHLNSDDLYNFLELSVLFGKMLARLKISAGLKNYENLKIENFPCFFSSAGQNSAWFLSEDRILTGRANIFPEPTFFQRLDW
jgi:hypothetical protein